MTTVLKGEKIAGHAVTLHISDATNRRSAVVFVVKWGRLEEESLSNFREFECIDRAMGKYEAIKRELSQKSFNLFEHLCHCRDQCYTPYETANYLFEHGYNK